MRMQISCIVDIPVEEKATWIEGFVSSHIAYAFSERFNISPDDVRVSNLVVEEAEEKHFVFTSGTGNTFYAGFKKDAKWRESQIPEHISTVQGCELAVRVAKEKAIEAFRQFVEQYCTESGHYDISNESEHYISVFEELINK